MANVRRKSSVIEKAQVQKIRAWKLLMFKAFEEEDSRALEAIINIAELGDTSDGEA